MHTAPSEGGELCGDVWVSCVFWGFLCVFKGYAVLIH